MGCLLSFQYKADAWIPSALFQNILLTEYGESDVVFQSGCVITCLTGVSSRIRGSHLLRVDRLIRALGIQDKVALSARPRIRPIILVPGDKKKSNLNVSQIRISELIFERNIKNNIHSTSRANWKKKKSIFLIGIYSSSRKRIFKYNILPSFFSLIIFSLFLKI